MFKITIALCLILGSAWSSDFNVQLNDEITPVLSKPKLCDTFCKIFCSLLPVHLNLTSPQDLVAERNRGFLCTSICKLTACKYIVNQMPFSENLIKDETVEPGSFDQIIHIVINYHDKDSVNNYLQIQDAVLEYGKWTNDDVECNEVPSPNQIQISKDQNQTANIYVCGRQPVASGPEGSFVLNSNINGVQRAVYRVEFELPLFGSNQLRLVNLQGTENLVVCETTESYPTGISKILNCFKY